MNGLDLAVFKPCFMDRKAQPYDPARLGLPTLVGCSSHSGRRTFGTRAARKVVEAGGSLRDVQQLLGHKDLSTTQKYIDGSEEAKRRLVQLI